MGAPTDGELSLLKIKREDATGEYSTSVAPYTHISLNSLSTNANTDNPSANRPDGSAPHAMTEFYNYYGTALHTTTFTPDYLALYNYGSYIRFGGLNRPGAGFQTEVGSEMVDPTFPSSGTLHFMNIDCTSVRIEQFYTYYTATTASNNWQRFYLGFELSYSGSISLSDIDETDGFNGALCWLDGEAASTQPDLSVDIASVASVTKNGGGSTGNASVSLYWDVTAVSTTEQKDFSNYFGTNTTAANNGSHTILIF